MSIKKPFITFAILFIFFGCKNPTNRAKKLIEIELSKTMNDFDSYEAIEFGKLDSTFTQYERKFLSYNIDTVTNFDALEKKQQDFEKSQDINEKSFKPIFNGYSMIHSFRGKNSLGAKVINKYRFFFNTNLDSVQSVTDMIKLEEDLKEAVEQAENTLDELKH